MRLYVNTNLVASLNLVEERVLDNVSSDLFIGGRGGEFRGIIESVRVDSGEDMPILHPLSVTDNTLGFWDFEDEIHIPNLHFFNNRNEAAPYQGRDGTADHKGDFELPLVFIGYDFQNINDLGYFRIYQRSSHQSGNDDSYSALEKIASFATGIELDSIKKQTWYSTSLNLNAFAYGTNIGVLDYLASDRIKHSTLNAIINQSGTHPITGLSKSASGRLINLTTGADIGLANVADLDPMVNPIERIRIIALDFANDRVICQSVHLTNDDTSAASIENHPKGQGMLFDHADGTPIWLVLGNADLVLDGGNQSTSSAVPNQVTRQKDAFTRATFTQGQRFEDKSGFNNTAYFTSIQSRITSSLASSPPSIEAAMPDPPRFDSNLITWLPVNTLTGLSDGATVTHLPDYSGNDFGVYTVGTWAYEAQSPVFNSLPALKITSATGALVNIGTTDGESKEMTHDLTTNGFTAFFLIQRPSGTLTANYDLIGENAGTSKTFFGQTVDPDRFFLTNNGATTTISGANTTEAGLLSISFDHSTTNATIHHHTNAGGTFVGTVLANYRFDDRLFALFGRALTSDPAAKTATASDKAPQNMRFAEFLLYDRVLTDTERLEVQGYFFDKYTVI
jgi:hypothetical protein